MKLTEEQFESLQEALEDAFPRKIDLKKMLRIKVDKDLEKIVGDGNQEDIIFELIDRAERDRWLDKLITGAYKYNPENELLNKFYHDYFSNHSFSNAYRPIASTEERPLVQPDKEYLYRSLNQYYFDLETLIEQCLWELDGQGGLIGLAVPCDDDAFRENFCQRLKDELGRSHVKIKRPLTLNPLFSSLDTTVERIKSYKQTLQKEEIICPIQVQIFDPNSSIPDHFWQAISAEFGDVPEHRLIMIMVGSEGCVFPQGVIKLEPPQFTKVHVHKWVVKVTKYRGWAEQFIVQLKQHMIADCCVGDPNSGLLDIRHVYEYLDFTMQLLPGSHSAEAFLQELEQRS